MQQVNVEGLRRMLGLLEQADPNKFNLEVWSAPRYSIKEQPWYKFWKPAEIECGTVACAVGMAAADSWFMVHGLHMVNRTPIYQDKQKFEAVAAFFGIEEDTAFWLFHAEEYASGRETVPSQVAYRIQKVLEDAELAGDPPKTYKPLAEHIASSREFEKLKAKWRTQDALGI